MENKKILQKYLLSETNIEYLLETIFCKYKLSDKAKPKCTNIITNYLNNYLNNINRYPNNNSEIITAMDFLNKKCLEDFNSYLLKKYPDTNFLKTNSQIDQTQSINSDTRINSTNCDDIIILNEKEKDLLLEKYNKPNINLKNVIILSETEKNALLEKYGMKDPNSNQNNNNLVNSFLCYLSNPYFFKTVGSMLTQTNDFTKNTCCIIEEILDEDQVQQLLGKKSVQDNIQEQKIEQHNSDMNINYSTNDEKNHQNINSVSDEKNLNLDLSKMTNESLIIASERLKEIKILQNKSGNKNLIEALEKEKRQIIDAMSNFKKNNLKIINTTESDNKIDKLNLEFNLSNDPEDLKNIVINIDVDKKIHEISLLSYFLPFNRNNVTRLNNKFYIYFNNKVNKIDIQPGVYDISLLCEYIKNQLDYIELSINDEKYITITNTMNINFDILSDEFSIFPMLGFRNVNYKNKSSYQASHPYNLDANKKIYFNISSSMKDPHNLVFDKNVDINDNPLILKRTSFGFNLKSLILFFYDEIKQRYDFVLPFKMCFQITYL